MQESRNERKEGMVALITPTLAIKTLLLVKASTEVDTQYLKLYVLDTVSLRMGF